MKKILLATLFATVAGALVFGAAASLIVNSNDLGSGDADVASCDGEVDVAYTLDAADSSLVDTITVSAIDAVTCVDQTVYVTVTDATSAIIHNDSAAVAASVSFSDIDLVAEDVEDIVVTITG